MSSISGKKIVIVSTNGFEQSELFEPRKALQNAGARVDIVSPESGKIQGFKHFEKGQEVGVDQPVNSSRAKDYDALVIPGGLFNPDQLRINDEAIRFTREFFDQGKPVAAICHGPWLLINAGVVEGRKMTAVHSIHRDLANAGARVVDQEVVVDEGLITSRTPKDLAAFCSKLVEEIAEGYHAGQEEAVH